MEVFDLSKLKSDAVAESNADIREIKTDDFKNQFKRFIWKISDNNEKILSIRKSVDRAIKEIEAEYEEIRQTIKALAFAGPQAIAV